MTWLWEELRDRGVPEDAYRWRRLRRSLGFTISELARRIDVSYDILAKLEKGQLRANGPDARAARAKLDAFYGEK